MPHLVIDCSEDILKLKSPNEIMQNVFNSAASTNLFELGDIKVRINPFQYNRIGNSNDNFIHVFGNIMEGRTSIQKSLLSKEIITN